MLLARSKLHGITVSVGADAAADAAVHYPITWWPSPGDVQTQCPSDAAGIADLSWRIASRPFDGQSGHRSCRTLSSLPAKVLRISRSTQTRGKIVKVGRASVHQPGKGAPGIQLKSSEDPGRGDQIHACNKQAAAFVAPKQMAWEWQAC